MTSKIKFLNLISFCLVLFGLYQLGYTGETGKISGQIIAKDTGEPLAGANIVVEDMLLGSSTDLDGMYFILHLPPGKYTLTITYLGYAEMHIENVRVRSDYTTRVDVEMEVEALELGDEIVVVASRPVIQKDLTSSTQFMDIDELSQLPVTNSEEAIFLQTGVLFDALPMIGGLGGRCTIL